MTSETRAKDYGRGVCPVCKREFERRSGSAIVCSDPRCRRARKTTLARQAKAKRRRTRQLRPVEGALRDVALQVTLDEARQVGYNQLAARWRALEDCRDNLDDGDARIALRQALIDVAAICVQGASGFPAPTAQDRLDQYTKGRATQLANAAL